MSVLYFAGFSFLMSGQAPHIVNFLYSFTIPIAISSRLPQIYQNYNESGVGSLNLITFGLNFVGAIARIGTSLVQLDDKLVLLGYVSSAILNGIITFQIIYYNYIARPKPKQVVEGTKKKQSVKKDK